MRTGWGIEATDREDGEVEKKLASEKSELGTVDESGRRQRPARACSRERGRQKEREREKESEGEGE